MGKGPSGIQSCFLHCLDIYKQTIVIQAARSKKTTTTNQQKPTKQKTHPTTTKNPKQIKKLWICCAGNSSCFRSQRWWCFHTRDRYLITQWCDGHCVLPHHCSQCLLTSGEGNLVIAFLKGFCVPHSSCCSF